jgi:hypothetical protein
MTETVQFRVRIPVDMMDDYRKAVAQHRLDPEAVRERLKEQLGLMIAASGVLAQSPTPTTTKPQASPAPPPAPAQAKPTAPIDTRDLDEE